jgi:hypothetical protein
LTNVQTVCQIGVIYATKQLTTMWEIRFSSSVYFSYDLWDAKLSALLSGMVIWVDAAALSSDVKIKA